MKKKNRRLPPHIVLPNGQWRFIKKGKVGVKTIKSRGKKIMARRKYFGRARGYYRKASGYAGKAGLSGAIPAAAGGALDVVARKFIPVNGAGSAAAGWLLKDGVTMRIGFNKIGESIGSMFFGNGGSGNGGGWL